MAMTQRGTFGGRFLAAAALCSITPVDRTTAAAATPASAMLGTRWGVIRPDLPIMFNPLNL